MDLVDELLDDEATLGSNEEDVHYIDSETEEAPAPSAPEEYVLDFSEQPEQTVKAEPETDATIQLGESQILSGASEALKTSVTEAQTNVDKIVTPKAPGVGGAEALFTQSETLRVAQQKIVELEREIERLRGENEGLAAAGETIRKSADEWIAKADRLEAKNRDLQDQFMEEKEILTQSLSEKQVELQGYQKTIEELEMRLSTNIQKIRVRERELENRLELVKVEGNALVRSKDEMILDLKRQLDQLKMELDNYRSKGHALHKQINEKQEMLRRTVKTLRLALTMLEGDEGEALKKAE